MLGIHFLPVDKNVYLRIQSFLNYCENALDAIKYSAFLYREYLVWSGLEQDDMRALYRWLMRKLRTVRKSTATPDPSQCVIEHWYIITEMIIKGMDSFSGLTRATGKSPSTRRLSAWAPPTPPLTSLSFRFFGQLQATFVSLKII